LINIEQYQLELDSRTLDELSHLHATTCGPHNVLYRGKKFGWSSASKVNKLISDELVRRSLEEQLLGSLLSD
jgi:hypothetical protein